MWNKHLKIPVIWWSIGAVTTLTSMAWVARIRHIPYTNNFLSWDSGYYLDLIKNGYLRDLPQSNGRILENRDAFFPIFPTLVRCADAVLPGHELPAFLFINVLASLSAIVIFYYCARELLSPDKAHYATALFGVFPGSFVYFWIYSEAVSVLVIVVAITLLVKKHPYFSAAVFGIGAATRPNAVFMGLAPVIFLAGEHVRTHTPYWNMQYARQCAASLVRILYAGALSVSGFVVFILYIDRITRISGAWFRIQREGWNESTHPFYSLRVYAHHARTLNINVRVSTVIISTFLCFFFIVALFMYCKNTKFVSLSLALCIPSVIIIILGLSNYSTPASLRFSIIAVPIFIALASLLPARSIKFVIPISIVLLFGLCFFYTWGLQQPFLMGSPLYITTQTSSD